MPSVKIDNNNNVIDVTSNKIIGKMENGNIILFNESNENSDNDEIETVEKEPKTKEEKDLIESQKKEELKKEKSSFVQEITKYEVTPNTKFLVEFGIIPIDERFVIVDKKALDSIKFGEYHWAKFRMWNFKEELEWKNKCTEFNENSKMQIINYNKLNEIKIKRLILDWSFAEKSEHFKLLHTDGVLSDESYEIFCGLMPNIANAIINGMNAILEENQ